MQSPTEWIEDISRTLLESPDVVDDEFLRRCTRTFSQWLHSEDVQRELADEFVLVAPLLAVHWAPLIDSVVDTLLLDCIVPRVHVKEAILAWDAAALPMRFLDRPAADRMVRMLAAAVPAAHARTLPSYAVHCAADWRKKVVAPSWSPRARMRNVAAAAAALGGAETPAAAGGVEVRNAHGLSSREVELAASTDFFGADMVAWTRLSVQFPAALAQAFPRIERATGADTLAQVYLAALGSVLIQLPHAQTLAIAGDPPRHTAPGGAGETARELADDLRLERARSAQFDAEYAALVAGVLDVGHQPPLAGAVAGCAASYRPSTCGSIDTDGDDADDADADDADDDDVLLGIGVWVLYHAKIGRCAPIFGSVLSPASRAFALVPAAVQMLRSPHPAVASKGVELAAAVLGVASIDDPWVLATDGRPDLRELLVVSARALLQYAERESATMLLSRRAVDLLGRLLRRCAPEARYVMLRRLLLASDVSGGARAYMVDLVRELYAGAGAPPQIRLAVEQELVPELLRRVPADDAGELLRSWDYMVALLVLLRHLRLRHRPQSALAGGVVQRILSTVDRTVDQYRMKAHAEEQMGGAAPAAQTQGATRLFMLRHLIESIGN